MNSNFSMILIPLKLYMHFQCLINSFPTTPKPPLRNNELHNFTSSPLVFIYPVCLISKSLDDPKIMHTHYMAFLHHKCTNPDNKQVYSINTIKITKYIDTTPMNWRHFGKACNLNWNLVFFTSSLHIYTFFVMTKFNLHSLFYFLSYHFLIIICWSTRA